MGRRYQIILDQATLTRFSAITYGTLAFLLILSDRAVAGSLRPTYIFEVFLRLPPIRRGFILSVILIPADKEPQVGPD